VHHCRERWVRDFSSLLAVSLPASNLAALSAAA
jgi:hypothetical protein